MPLKVSCVHNSRRKKLKYIWKINVTRTNTFLNGQEGGALKRSDFFTNLFVALSSSLILKLKSDLHKKIFKSLLLE